MVGHKENPDHVPGPRSGYTLTMAGGNGYLFGGLDAAAAEPTSALHVLSPSKVRGRVVGL